MVPLKKNKYEEQEGRKINQRNKTKVIKEWMHLFLFTNQTPLDWTQFVVCSIHTWQQYSDTWIGKKKEKKTSLDVKKHVAQDPMQLPALKNKRESRGKKNPFGKSLK